MNRISCIQIQKMITLCSSEKPNLPSFIRKIFQILSTSTYSHVICWDKDGKSIKIFDFKDLQEEVLDQEFRHKNHRSFIRQLNMYGFKKMRKSTTTTIYFFHPLFTRDGEENLHLIERKRENKRRLKLDILDESEGEEQKDEELKKMKKRKAVLKFLGMESLSSENPPVLLQQESNSISSSGNLKGQTVTLNPTNAIKQRKTSINVGSVDPLKNSSKLDELSKRSLELHTHSTLRKDEIHSDNKMVETERKNSETKYSERTITTQEIQSLRSQFSNSENKGFTTGFTTYEHPVSYESFPNFPTTTTTNSEKMFQSVPMFQCNPFPQCVYQVPQFPMYHPPMFFGQPQQFQYFAFPQ